MLRFEQLENRENPIGPVMMGPIAPLTPAPVGPPVVQAPTELPPELPPPPATVTEPPFWGVQLVDPLNIGG